MRWHGVVLLFAGCDKLFGLAPLPDAAIDAQVHDASLAQIGCADGTREGFADLAAAPAIAACAGAWTIGGVRPAPASACERRAGNSGVNVLGEGCTAADLCAEGWEVCRDRIAVMVRAPDQSCSSATTDPAALFITGQSGPGGASCNDTDLNDVFGCGTLGVPVASSCAPLDRSSDNDCFELRRVGVGGWTCSAPEEPKNIRKLDPYSGGGVLCCRTRL